jgi:hypothetical protein
MRLSEATTRAFSGKRRWRERCRGKMRWHQVARTKKRKKKFDEGRYFIYEGMTTYVGEFIGPWGIN